MKTQANTHILSSIFLQPPSIPTQKLTFGSSCFAPWSVFFAPLKVSSSVNDLVIPDSESYFLQVVHAVAASTFATVAVMTVNPDGNASTIVEINYGEEEFHKRRHTRLTERFMLSKVCVHHPRKFR